MRRALLCIAVGVLALLTALLLGLGFTVPVMPSYLAAWLFFLGLPVGALPLLMLMELAGTGARPLAFALRWVVAVLPVAALLAIPFLLALPHLYPWTGAREAGFAGAWLRSGPFTIRCIVYLVIWVLLGLVFMWPPRPEGSRWRGTLAGVGLALHLVIGTLAALDWAMSLQPGLNSSVFGLLLILSQSGAALSAALLLAAAVGDAAAVASGAALLLALLGAWVFVQFTQYLIVWSADLPAEIVWYQHRGAGLGWAAAWCALACCLVPPLVLLPRRATRSLAAVAVMAALVLLVHLGEVLWLVTPSARGRFTISGPDVLLIVGVGGVVLGCMLAWQRRDPTARPGAPAPDGGQLARA